MAGAGPLASPALRTGKVVVPLDKVEALVQRHLAVVAEHQPTEATALGDHRRDDDLPALHREDVESYLGAVERLHDDTVEALAAIPAEAQGDAREARGDLDLLQRDLEARIFWLRTRPSLELDPLAALNLASSAIHELLRRTDLPVERQHELVRAAARRVAALPELLEQAGRLLDSSPAPHLEVAQQRCRGLAGLATDELLRRTAEVAAPRDPAERAAGDAIEAIDAYRALLDELDERPHAPWRLGRRQHAVVLRSSLATDMTAEDIAARADRALTAARAELSDLAGRHWGELVGEGPPPRDDDERTRRVLQAVAEARAVDRAALVTEARRAIAEARAFALDTALTDVPPADLLTVTTVPPFLQGVAVAFITQAPALEPDAGSVYYLSPVPSHFDDQQARSFLREYNAAALRSLAVHEGYPGHFVQLEHAARHPRLARRLLVSSTFAEGWAVYIERLAAQRGFGDAAYRVTQLKMALRVAANALLDVGLHVGELTDDDAMGLLTGQAFQETQEARGKLVRAKVTAGQLSSYFVGSELMWQLRGDEERRLGGRFDERRFHQQVLSHGTPTFAVLRAALADPAAAIRRPFA